MTSINRLQFVIITMALTCLIFVGTAAIQSYGRNEKYRAKLDGNNEIPAVNTTAEGVVNFKTKDGSLSWKMNITGITDATGAHIHKGRNGTNGDVVVDLLKLSKHSNTPQGMVMRGNITDSSLTGPMKGQTVKDLQTAMANGDTYVNVHTKDHPKGEIRGQVKLKGEGAASTSNVTAASTNSTS